MKGWGREMGYSKKMPDYVSPEDYLLLDERSTTKLEYLDGVIYDWQGGGPVGMAGGHKDHNLVGLNVYRTFWEQLKGSGCRIFVADVKLATSDESAFFFPDLMVTCSETDRDFPFIVKEPLVVVEILSPSTELFDRRKKLLAYQRFPSFESCVMVSFEQRTIEVYTRKNGWARTMQTEPVHPLVDEVIDVGIHDLRLHAAEVFAGLQ